MSETRHLHVARELVPWFAGWLEFAGTDVPGVDRCPEWPKRFTIDDGLCHHAECVAGDVAHFCVTSDEWPTPPSSRCAAGHDHICEWVPTFYRSGVAVTERGEMSA